jgi:hypothetical protein
VLATTVIATLRLEGFHEWPQAPPSVAYLKDSHRHIFHIRVETFVGHADREVEFQTLGRGVRAFLQHEFGDPMRLGSRSCEHLATLLVEEFQLAACEVWEDGENGARVGDLARVRAHLSPATGGAS